MDVERIAHGFLYGSFLFPDLLLKIVVVVVMDVERSAHCFLFASSLFPDLLLVVVVMDVERSTHGILSQQHEYNRRNNNRIHFLLLLFEFRLQYCFSTSPSFPKWVASYVSYF